MNTWLGRPPSGLTALIVLAVCVAKLGWWGVPAAAFMLWVWPWVGAGLVLALLSPLILWAWLARRCSPPEPYDCHTCGWAGPCGPGHVLGSRAEHGRPR